MRKKKIIFCLAVMAALACSKKRLPTAELEIKGHTVTIEIARNNQDRTQGLSDRRSIPENHGMLFVFPDERQRTFWMYHCYIDLDIAYIDRSGVILEITTMVRQPYETPESQLIRYPSKSTAVKYALEMNSGWFENHQVGVNDRLDITAYDTLY